MLTEPITGVVGARIRDVDLSTPLSPADVSGIKAALKRHKVLVFEDQGILSPETFTALASNFGDPLTAKHSTHEHFPECPAVKILKTDGKGFGGKVDDSWHTDGSATEKTRWISLLQAVDVPPYGRDTLFADMEAAFDQLSTGVQTLVEGLSAVHSWGRQDPEAPPIEHPLVLTDRETGRKTLYADRGYTRSIVGMREVESQTLLSMLFLQAHIPECQVRVSWKKGSLVMWDNQRTQHYLVQDAVYPRVMHRVMVYPPEA